MEVTSSAESSEIAVLPLVAVCVATYKRPGFLGDLLHSIRSMTMEGFQAQLIVVDNDADRTAQLVVTNFVDDFPVSIRYVVELTRGIASARNKLIKEAITIGADYVAFVDDDQLVEPDWLQRLIEVANTTQAEAVAGRWIPHFEEGIPVWVCESGFWDRPPVITGSPAKHFGTGNVLINVAAMSQIPGPFDESRNLTGGTDTLFFDEFHRRGFVTVWSNESIVHERISPSRATITWMLSRRFRVGVNQAVRHKRSHSSQGDTFIFLLGSGSRVVKHSGLLMFDAMRGRGRFVVRLSRIAEACGRISGMVGIDYEEYHETHGG